MNTILEEITPRLTAEVANRIAFADRLKPALDLACRQLEHLSPAVLGQGKEAMIVASLATSAPVGSWLIVLANPRKVLTINLGPPAPGFTRADILTECVAAMVKASGQPPDPSSIIEIIDFVTSKYGAKPAVGRRSLPHQTILNILGCLFGTCRRDDILDITHAVELAVADGVCPLHVGLIGKGTKPGTRCGVWPIGLPFVPYLDSIGLA